MPICRFIILVSILELPLVPLMRQDDPPHTVQAKFGKMPDEICNRLSTLKEQEDIKQAMRKAINSESLEEFLSKLEH